MEESAQTWLDVYFKWFRGYYVAASIATAVLIFCIGLAIAWLIRFDDVYLRTIPVYLGVFGIAWVGSWGGWGSQRIRSIVREIRPAFLEDNGKYESISSLWLRRLVNIKIHLFASSLLVMGSWIYVALVTSLGQIPWFPESWSEDPFLWAKNVILDIYAVPILLLLVTGGVVIVTYSLFVSALTRLPLVPLADVAIARLRPVTDFGLASGMAWSVGVSLFVILFRPAFDPLSVAAVVLLTTLGLLMLFWPQYVIHRKLNRVKETLWNTAADMLSKEFPGSANATPEVFLRTMLNPQAQQLDSLRRSIANSSTWVYDPRDVLPIAGTWLLPLVIMAIQWR